MQGLLCHDLQEYLGYPQASISSRRGDRILGETKPISFEEEAPGQRSRRRCLLQACSTAQPSAGICVLQPQGRRILLCRPHRGQVFGNQSGRRRSWPEANLSHASDRCDPCTNTKTSTNVSSIESMQYTALQRRTLPAGMPHLKLITIETIIWQI